MSRNILNICLKISDLNYDLIINYLVVTYAYVIYYKYHTRTILNEKFILMNLNKR